MYLSKNNKAVGPDGLPAELFKTVGRAYVPANSQNMAKGKYAQRLEPQCPLFCPEKGRPYNMRQLQGYKPSTYRI